MYPLVATLDATGEPLVALLRPGNAGSGTAADTITVLDAALAQIPVDPHTHTIGDFSQRPFLVEEVLRTDPTCTVHINPSLPHDSRVMVLTPVDGQVMAVVSPALAEQVDLRHREECRSPACAGPLRSQVSWYTAPTTSSNAPTRRRRDCGAKQAMGRRVSSHSR